MTANRPSLKNFDAYADRNGQDIGSDSPLDLGVAARTQHDLNSDPMSEAETARHASGFDHVDSRDGGTIATVEATEAETPPENLRRISDPTPRASTAAPSRETPATRGRRSA